jgi:hypothetical protein
VRDWILMTLLAPRYGAALAVLSAVLLRVVWLLSELVISGILYLDVLRARHVARKTHAADSGGPAAGDEP